jgi:hypothetical protein
MRLLGWIVAVVLGVGSFCYAGAIWAAVKVGGFFVVSFFPDVETSKSSSIRLYFEILFSECRFTLALAGVLSLLLLSTKPRLNSRKSTKRIEASFAAINDNNMKHIGSTQNEPSHEG